MSDSDDIPITKHEDVSNHVDSSGPEKAQPDQRNDESHKQAKSEEIERDSKYHPLGKTVASKLIWVGEIGTGIACITGLVAWFWFHPIWSFWLAILSFPPSVFVFFQILK